MNIQKDISLKPYNTFGIDAKAKIFIQVETEEELREALSQYPNAYIFGGGSNVLITKDIEQPVIQVNIQGISVHKGKEENFVYVTAKAGENWNNFVQFCLKNNYGGAENLSLIYGNVGATLVQNIGAYGVEIKDIMTECQAIHKENLTLHTFTNAECKFGYRESIFKNEAKDKYVITSVTFRLSSENHILHINYGDIQKKLSEKNIKNYTIQDVAQAIITIRQSKLPNPALLGNSGSFFKNPIVRKDFFLELQKKYPQMPHYEVSTNEVKIPAGYLIDSCGLKGYRKADAGVHSQQALVLVNYGNASGNDIYQLAKFIQKTVFDTYQIHLDMEVNVL
ncbi:MAG: UDP-N-acetylmuramate dehydrogenase [Capnocytophaga sp.]|nr:UDP-N-acetylmuramate dehydrogenase [Capnocytophaga sp.]